MVSRAQLRELGLGEGEIDHGIASARLFPVFQGAFAVGRGRLERRGRLLAATLACGDGSVVSHGTAAALLGLWEHEPHEVDVIAPVEAGRRIAGIRRRHVPAPLPRDRWIYEGVPCTTPSRTIVDVAGIVRERLLRRTVEQAAVERMLNVPEIDAILAGPTRRGSPMLRLVLADWRRYPRAMRIRSPMEAKLLPLLTQHDVEIPLVNEKLTVADEVFEIDFLWPRQRLCVETDGGKFHGHPLAEARDSRRNRILAGSGYRVRRLAWADLEDRPRLTMHELTRLLDDGLRQRRPARGARA